MLRIILTSYEDELDDDELEGESTLRDALDDEFEELVICESWNWTLIIVCPDIVTISSFKFCSYVALSDSSRK